MKKVIVSLLVALSLVMMPSVKAASVPEVTDHEKVTVYLFWWENCGHCHNLIKYFSDKFLDYSDYFEFKTFETTTKDNGKLMTAMNKYFDFEDGAIPLVIIGNNFYHQGYADEEIINAALEAYQDSNYTDLVAKVISENKFELKPMTFVEAAEHIGIQDYQTSKNNLKVETEKKNDGLIVGAIFAVIIAGFVGLVIYSRKN